MEVYSVLRGPSYTCACRAPSLSPVRVHMKMKTVWAFRNPAQVFNFQSRDHRGDGDMKRRFAKRK